MENENNVLENEDVTISKAMKDIYLSCDIDGINKVQVSNLVDFIKPFMPDHVSELLELQAALDPENVNPFVSSSFFYNVMTEWAKKVNEEASNSKETDFLNMTPNVDMGKFDENQFVPYVQSTPRSSFGNRFLRGYVELNKSLQTSFLNNTQGGALDKTFYEDQINELVHQNRKGADELSRVKLQLGNAEEQNEILQAELKKINKLLSHEHEVNENLQKERTDCEDLRDASLNAKQQLDKLTRQLSNMEKENANLKQQIKYIEKEKVQCEEKNVRILAKMEETRRSFIELQTEQNYKDKEMAQLEQINMDIMKEVDEHKKIIDDYKDTIECLQVEKNKLERMLHEKMKNSSRRHSASFSEYRNSSILIQQKSPHNTSAQHSNTSATQVPFVPAVSTDRFEFFNIDSPYARRKYHSIILDRSVPGDVKEIQTLKPTQATNTKSNTCKDVIPYKPFRVPQGDDEAINSPPPIFIMGRTPPNRNNDSSSEEEFMLKLQMAASNQSPHQSLQSELSQFKDQFMPDQQDLDSSVQNEFNEHQKNELLINLLRADSDISKRQIAEDKAKIEELIGNNADLENKLKEFHGINDKWRELMDNYNKILIEKETLQAANDTNSQKIRTLTTDLANIQNENISNYDGLVKGHEQLQIELAQLRDYKTNTDNRFRELQSEIAHVTNQLESEVDQHNISKKSLAQIESIHNMLEDDYNKLQTNFDSLLMRFNADNTLHQENVNRLERLNCEKVREIEELQREIDVNNRKFKSEIQEVNMKLDSLQNENSSWMMRHKEADSLRKQLSETIVQLESRNKNLYELLCNAGEEKQYYVKKLEDVGKHINKSQMDMDVLEEEFTKHCHNMSFLVNENTSLRIELSDVTEDRQKILEYLSSCSRELKEILSTRFYKCMDCRKEPTMFTNYDTILSQYLETRTCVLEYHRANFESSLTKLNDDLRSKDLEILNLRARLDVKERELVESSKEEMSEDDVRPEKHSRNVDSKRNKHGRMQYKLDKLEDKVVYFQELLEKERKDKDKLSIEWKQKLANLVRDNEMKVEKESASTVVIIFDNRHRLRRSIFNFVKKWRFVLENIPSMEDVLDKIDNDEPLLSNRNYDRPIDKEMFLLKIEVQLIINMLERLGEIDFIDLVNLLERKTVFSFSVPASCSTSNSGFSLKPPTLLARPVSPDSPSVEQEMSHTALADYTLTANNDKQDIVTNNDSRQLSPDSAGGHYVDTVSNGSVSIEEINSSDDHQEVNNTIYEDAENGDRPMFAYDGVSQSFENFERESLTDSELEEKFMTFVLQFTMESNTIKQRCEKQSAELNKSELEMTTLFQDFNSFLQRHLKGESLKLAERKVEQLLVDGLRLSRSAELLGGLKQENRMLSAINLMINYVSTLRKKLDALTLKLQRCTNLHRELVSVSEFHVDVPSPLSRSDSFQQVFRRGRMLGVVSICCAVLSIVLALLFISSGILCTQPNDTITVGDLMELFLAKDYSDEPPPS